MNSSNFNNTVNTYNKIRNMNCIHDYEVETPYCTKCNEYIYIYELCGGTDKYNSSELSILYGEFIQKQFTSCKNHLHFISLMKDLRKIKRILYKRRTLLLSSIYKNDLYRNCIMNQVNRIFNDFSNKIKEAKINSKDIYFALLSKKQWKLVNKYNIINVQYRYKKYMEVVLSEFPNTRDLYNIYSYLLTKKNEMSLDIYNCICSGLFTYHVYNIETYRISRYFREKVSIRDIIRDKRYNLSIIHEQETYYVMFCYIIDHICEKKGMFTFDPIDSKFNEFHSLTCKSFNLRFNSEKIRKDIINICAHINSLLIKME